SNPNAVLLLDADGRIEFANLAAGHLFGRPRRELVRQSWSDLTWETPDAPAAGPARRGQERALRRPDGSRAIVACSLVRLRDDRGTRAGMVASFTDITERRRAEETLARQHALLRGVLNTIPDLVTRKSAAGVYEGCNSAFAAFVGRPVEQITGRTDAELFGAERAAAVRAADEAALAAGRSQRSEEWLTYRDGRRALFETLRAPLADADGRSLGLLAVGRDITERRGLEEQLRQAQKLEAVGQLAGGVAHDFNNLLTAILGNLSLAQSLVPDDHAARELLAEAELAGGRAADLTRQLLGFARRQPVKLAPV